MGSQRLFAWLCTWFIALAATPVAALVPPMPLAATTKAVITTTLSSAPLLHTATLWLAADTDMELAELPPPYVPALFGVALLVGVGVLTGSLGNVMDEEASLGMQSGARAKKEIERSRSSYFKRK